MVTSDLFAVWLAYIQKISGIVLMFILQELINRHLITMAQIDQSENPGKTLLFCDGLVTDGVKFL